MNDVMPPRALPGASAASGPRRGPVEIPTLLLIFATYAGWLAATHTYGRWPLIIVSPLLILIVTLHSSLQHEMVHGHPTGWNTLNRLLAIVPLSLWLPYEHYRRTHTVHHIDERLTDPLDDPETYYWTAEGWARLKPLTRVLIEAQQTLAGRIVIGAFWSIGKFLRADAIAVIRNEQGVRAYWIEHLLWCVPVVAWLKLACGMPLWIYFLAVVIPANGILLIRSFAEHRALPQTRQRIAIVEGSWILGPLFLFNNLHSLHHEAPGVPWYEYPSRYRRIRERLIAENGGLVYRSYFEVARRFLFHPHDRLLHPTDRAPRPT